MIDPTLEGVTIEVEYSCHKCRTTETITVPARNPASDVVAWVDFIMRAVERAHSTAAPECTHRYVDLKIPVAKDGDPLGTPRKH